MFFFGSNLCNRYKSSITYYYATRRKRVNCDIFVERVCCLSSYNHFFQLILFYLAIELITRVFSNVGSVSRLPGYRPYCIQCMQKKYKLATNLELPEQVYSYMLPSLCVDNASLNLKYLYVYQKEQHYLPSIMCGAYNHLQCISVMENLRDLHGNSSNIAYV